MVARKHMKKNSQVAQFANSSSSVSEFSRLNKPTDTSALADAVISVPRCSNIREPAQHNVWSVFARSHNHILQRSSCFLQEDKLKNVIDEGY